MMFSATVTFHSTVCTYAAPRRDGRRRGRQIGASTVESSNRPLFIWLCSPPTKKSGQQRRLDPSRGAYRLTDNTAQTSFPSTPQRARNISGGDGQYVKRAWRHNAERRKDQCMHPVSVSSLVVVDPDRGQTRIVSTNQANPSAQSTRNGVRFRSGRQAIVLFCGPCFARYAPLPCGQVLRCIPGHGMARRGRGESLCRVVSWHSFVVGTATSWSLDLNLNLYFGG
ncbi:hypothetical protein IWX47DRAFT_227632 [Phyllosticta citricarpa]|uniref:Uncharacterized protein n=1 Tax=Phyllosticta citricarpa TaxID=55181 RepID=A0ABR1MLE6_9PEZI